ncbi:MAG: hypothetical protein RIS84_1946 [Pseudomonadota bacterium]|jgi:hypothetical protein
MQLPISLNSLLHPRPLFVLIALSSSVAIYGVLNDEQRVKEASHLQKEMPSVAPAVVDESASKGLTWAEAGKQLLALEEKRETATQLFQERFNKTEENPDKTLKRQGSPIRIADPMDTVKSPTTSVNPLRPHKTNKKKIKKRKVSTCCRCPIQKIKRRKPESYCR